MVEGLPWCELGSGQDRTPLVIVNGNLTIQYYINDMYPRAKSVRSWWDGSLVRSFMVDPLSYFSFQSVLYDLVTKAVVCAFLSVG